MQQWHVAQFRFDDSSVEPEFLSIHPGGRYAHRTFGQNERHQRAGHIAEWRRSIDVLKRARSVVPLPTCEVIVKFPLQRSVAALKSGTPSPTWRVLRVCKRDQKSRQLAPRHS